MQKNANTKPQRGALFVTMKPSTPTISAGSSFSISVTITNPFDIPVVIKQVSTLLPVDLVDIQKKALLAERKKARKEIDKTKKQLLKGYGEDNLLSNFPKRNSFWDLFRRLEISLFPGITLNLGPDLSYDYTRSAYALTTRSSSDIEATISYKNMKEDLSKKILDILKEMDNASEVKIETYELQPSSIEFFHDKSTSPSLDLLLDAIKKKQKQLIELKPDDQSKEEKKQEIEQQIKNAKQQVVALLEPLEEDFEKRFGDQAEQFEIQPGDSVTNIFILKTAKGWNFTPTSYNLDVRVEYEIEEILHRQTIPYSLDIQASQASMIGGAVLGSIFGVLASEVNALFDGNWLRMAPKMVLSAIISGFAVIAFARKAGVQPIIAVQDFWGGMLIGFLVGYSGTQVLGNLLSGPVTNTTAVSTAIPTIIP